MEKHQHQIYFVDVSTNDVNLSPKSFGEPFEECHTQYQGLLVLYQELHQKEVVEHLAEAEGLLR